MPDVPFLLVVVASTLTDAFVAVVALLAQAALIHRVDPRQRTIDCVVIERIAIQFLKLGIAQAYCGR